MNVSGIMIILQIIPCGEMLKMFAMFCSGNIIRTNSCILYSTVDMLYVHTKSAQHILQVCSFSVCIQFICYLISFCILCSLSTWTGTRYVKWIFKHKHEHSLIYMRSTDIEYSNVGIIITVGNGKVAKCMPVKCIDVIKYGYRWAWFTEKERK